MPAMSPVAKAAVQGLPEPVRGYLSARIDGVIERAVEPDGAWRRDSKMKARDEWHYLMLDAAAEEDSPVARDAAAEAFPSDRPAARRVFRNADVQRGGLLPWELADLADDLAAALKSGDETEIVRLAGYVIHFSADAADPFCATVDCRGERGGGPVFGNVPLGDTMFAHQDAAHRVGWELVRRNALRWAESVKVSPGSARTAEGVEDILAVMIEARRDHAALCAADREVLSKLGVTNASGFEARQDEYYLLMDERCDELCTASLTRGATLAAGLITSAWRRAGSPSLDDSRPASRQPTNPAEPSSGPQSPPSPPPPVATGFVASQKSKVFHSPDCNSVKRISPDNLISLSSIKEAEDSGRRPCKNCRPA